MKSKKMWIWRTLAVLFLLALFIPLLVILVWSIARSWPWPELLPGSISLRGWQYLADPHSRSLATLLYSVFLSGTVAALALFLTVPAAKALAQYRFPFRKQVELFLYLPVIVPSLSCAMGIHITFLKTGLANSFLGVVLIHLLPCLPYSLRILTSVFEIIGRDMEDQARVLGASPWQAVIHVIFPMLLPGLLSAFSMAFIISFSQYFLTALIGGGNVITFAMLMFPFIQSGDRVLGSVYSVVFILTALIFLAILEWITRKFYSSSLKEYYYI